MAQNLNQFGQVRNVGELDLQTNPNPAVMTVKINPASSALPAALIPGVGVKFVDLGASDPIDASAPIVDVRSGDSDKLDGVILFSTKGNAKKGSIVQIARNGAVVVMKAAAALARGVDVALDMSEPSEVIAVSSLTKFGRLLDKSTADGDLVRVLVEIVEA